MIYGGEVRASEVVCRARVGQWVKGGGQLAEKSAGP